MEKEYKITFTMDWVKIQNEENKDGWWNHELLEHQKELDICRKWRGKIIKLSEIPEFIKEVGEVILNEDEIEVYNDYRE